MDREPAANPSIGAYLARQRELRKISLDDLTRITQIPRRSLERLESGAFDRNPDGFTRGFVRTVAEALGLDPADTVARMLEEPRAPLSRPGLEAPDPRRWLRRLLIGVGVGVALWLVFGGRSRPTDSVVYRRDAVRELAQGVRDPQSQPDPIPAPPDAP